LPPPLPKTCFAYAGADFINKENQSKVYNRIEQTNRRAVAEVALQNTLAVNKG